MKQLQNNYTTPEQSKRLLELGVPANSADCIFTRFSRDEKWKRRFIEDVVSTQLFCNQDFYIPCWSVGRLIEIYNMCANFMPGMQLGLDYEPENCTYIEMIFSCFELAADNGLLDFSELEE